jgi:AraC-like DNA-binding protein/mannose-6-phosphate isomerase-like protein (cupin superfamily)
MDGKKLRRTKKQKLPAEKRGSDLSKQRIEASFANLEYLAHSRLMPRPFVQFVSGHMPAGIVTQSHSHPCIALHGCLQGPLVLVTSEGEKSLEAGMFCLLSPGVRHHWRNEGRQTAATLGVLIDAEHPGSWPAGSGVDECCQKLTQLVKSVHWLSVIGDDAIGRAFWVAADDLTSPKPPEIVGTVGAIWNLLATCVMRLDENSSPSTATANLAQQIRRLLVSRVNDRLSISDVARQLGVSPTRAKQAFRSAFDTGIIAYYNQLKIWQAKRWLCDLSLNVEQVSEKLGYSSQSYFSRVFFRQTGETPSDFRRRNCEAST